MRLYLFALLATALSFVSPAAPAQAAAAPVTVKMTFDAAPEPVVKGATLTLSGRVWLKEKGNRTKINFYFQKSGDPAAAYVYQGYTNTTDAGTYTRRFVAATTGTWKAVFPGTATRKNAARLDPVQVVQRRSKEVATYGPLNGNWSSPTIRIPTTDYKALVTYTCEDDGFLFVVWNYGAEQNESADSDRPGGTVTLNGHHGARSGYFEIVTWAGCSWKLRVFSGIVTTEV